MKIDIKAVHFDLPEDIRETFERKAHKIDFAADMIVDLMFTLTKEKDYKLEANINFRWGVSHHIHVNDYDLRAGIEPLFEKISQKVRKEKERIKDHKDHKSGQE